MNLILRLAVVVSWLFAVPCASWAAQSGSGNGALEGEIGYVRSAMTDSL